MKRTLLFSITVLVCISSITSADTFGNGDNQFDIDFVTISGNTNPASGIPAGDGFTFTGVSNDYRIGTYEITNNQWSRFKTAYGTVTGSPSIAYDESPHWTGINVPTNNVSWYEAAQFVNWLNINTDHSSAYKFTGMQGTNDYTFSVWDATDSGYDPSNPYRNSNAYYFMPTEDEWIKAAYWNGTTLQTYATIDNSMPVAGVDTNYDYAAPYGEHWTIGIGSEELNGTFDMMGNVWEYTESPWGVGDYASDSHRSIRGGAFDYATVFLESSYRFSDNYGNPIVESREIGFRIASIPEPITLMLVGLGGVLIRRR